MEANATVDQEVCPEPGLDIDWLLRCSICVDTMIEPSTLDCGHNFCRLCLARWWKACVEGHRATTCPMCGHQWNVIPGTNVAMRDMLEREMGEAAVHRREALRNDLEAQALLREFETARSKGARLGGSRGGGVLVQNAGLWRIGLMLLVGLIVLVVLLLTRTDTSSATSSADLSVRTWNVSRVQVWLSSLGEWGNDYKESFAKEKINGYLLMQLGEKELAEEFGIVNTLHRRAIVAEMKRLSSVHAHTPRDFFGYKKVHRRRAMFLLWSLKTFPRWTVIFCYMYNFDSVLVPLIKVGLDKGNLAGEIPLWLHAAMPLEHELSGSDWWEFWFWVLLLPYYLFLKFAWHFFDINFITAGVVISNCALLTLLEMSHSKWLLLQGGWRTLPKQCAVSSLGAVIAGVLFSILWPVIPFFICDVAFYSYLYFGPMDAAIKLYRRFWP